MRIIVVLSLVVCLGSGLCGLAVAQPPTYKFPSEVAITLPNERHDPCFDYAVAELARLLQRVDVQATTVHADLPGTTWQLRIGGDHGSIPSTNLKSDGYSIVVSPDGVTLAALEPKGVLNAVYDLAERLGYLFLYPGEEGEWPPQLNGARPTLPVGSRVATPRFPHRGIFNGCSEELWVSFYAKLRLNAFCNPLEKPLADRLGLRVEMGNHDLTTLFTRDDFEKYPDMFRRSQPDDFFGKRTSDFNLCISNPRARHTIQQNYLAKVKPLIEQGVYAWNAWPEDLPANGWCYCSTCRSFSPADQAMIAMSTLAEAVRQENLSIRVPVLAYHDTMFPGIKIDAPKEAFLLFAPRERCYGHALDDPTCSKNRQYFDALKAWEKKFAGSTDAHTFEYYFDRVLFRGLYAWLPDTILNDMKVYEVHGIQTHLGLHVGSSFIPKLNMLNMLVFARGTWDASLDSTRFTSDLASRILPTDPEPWQQYLAARAVVFQDALRWEHETEGWCDYRWLPETTLPFGREMVDTYRKAGVAIASASDALERSVKPEWPERVRVLATTEIARSHFESAEMFAMASQQDAANHVGAYLNGRSKADLQTGIELMEKSLKDFAVAREKADQLGAGSGDYYYMFNEWIVKELAQKIAMWKDEL